MSRKEVEDIAALMLVAGLLNECMLLRFWSIVPFGCFGNARYRVYCRLLSLLDITCPLGRVCNILYMGHCELKRSCQLFWDQLWILKECKHHCSQARSNRQHLYLKDKSSLILTFPIWISSSCVGQFGTAYMTRDQRGTSVTMWVSWCHVLYECLC